jgi:hypothetical protein
LPAGSAELAVAAEPAGAAVSIDGTPRGSSPLTLTLPAGTHQVGLSAPGYAAFTEAVTLTVGQRGILAPNLADQTGNTAEASTTITVGPEAEAQAAATAGAATPDATQATGSASPGAIVGPGPESTAAATAAPGDVSGQPTTDSGGSAPARNISPTTLTVTSISIPTYPYAAFMQTVPDPALADYPVPVLDRKAYDASHPQPVPVNYTLVVLENKYLRLSILPELGGRVYECIFKPTGHDEFYRNPVVKPTLWGPGPDIAPAGANWWLAAGGLEWGFPIAEHGYEWSTEWGYDPVTQGDGSVMVSLFTRDYQRPYVDVDIILPPDVAYFIVRPHITNPLGSAFRYKWWADAMLAPGGTNKAGAGLHFIYPVDTMTVHSTDDTALPATGQPMTWPITDGRDMSRLANWNGYLGFFERPAAQGDFTAAYDTAQDEGMVRTYPSATARGAKGFGLGWKTPLDPQEWTDDGSTYVEMHGGLAPTFDEWNELPAGGSVTWSETWYPAAKIGDIVYANAHAALNVTRSGSGVRVRVFPAEPIKGQLSVAAGGATPVMRALEIAPDRPFDEVIPAGAGQVKITITGDGGELLLSYSLR